MNFLQSEVKEMQERVNGVLYNITRQKWSAEIKVNDKRKHLGYYKTKFAAVLARNKAEQTYKFPNNSNFKSSSYYYLYVRTKGGWM